MKDSLWSKNFTLMFIGNIISSLGGVGLNVALGVIIFDQTASTLLSNTFVAISTIPILVLPLVVGVFVDNNNPLKLLLKNEVVLLVIYFITFFYTYLFGFNYIVYLGLFMLISSFSVISSIAGESVMAQLMPTKFMSKGYAIMSTISPLCAVIVTPITLYLYKKYGITIILFIYILLSIIDLLLEAQIKFDFKYSKNKTQSISQIKRDMFSGVNYIKEFSALKAVFLFFTIVIIANGTSTLIYPYFANSSQLSLSDYGLLMSVNSLGYLFGGFFHYFIEIPNSKRYLVALIIYAMFIIFDSIFLFMPLLVMLVMKFLLGLGGMNSANIRNTAVQASVENKNRGKVNGVFGMLMGFANIIGSLVFGVLGEFVPIPLLIILAQTIYLFVVIIFFINPKYDVKNFYNLKYSLD